MSEVVNHTPEFRLVDKGIAQGSIPGPLSLVLSTTDDSINIVYACFMRANS